MISLSPVKGETWEMYILPFGRKGGAFSAFAASELSSTQNDFYVKEAYFGGDIFWFLSTKKIKKKQLKRGK